MSSKSTNSMVSLKLLIDTKGKRVLFAEAGKDFVDFLFRIFSVPVGTIINLLKKHELMGSLSNLYQSIENLNDTYLLPNQTKDTLLKPVSPVSGFVHLLALNEAPPAMVKKFYCCMCYDDDYLVYVADDPQAVCPDCKKEMTTQLSYVAPPHGGEQLVSNEGGFVKGVVTYIVMDDLAVTPMPAISGITMLNKFNVKEVGALEEKVVSFGADEAVKLLDASLRSKKVLTDVFLSSKNPEVLVDDFLEKFAIVSHFVPHLRSLSIDADIIKEYISDPSKFAEKAEENKEEAVEEFDEDFEPF